MNPRPPGHRRPQRNGRSWLASDADPRYRLAAGVAMIAVVVTVGTVGYMVLGLGFVDALYQAVETVSTVGFGDIERTDAPAKVFTIVLILGGVAIVLYTLTLVLETVLEGRLTDQLWRARMRKDIDALTDHVIVAGCGRLGRVVAEYVAADGRDVVAIDVDLERLEETELLFVDGDATSEAVLERAGIDRASTLVTALATDADNVYLTLAGRARRPDLFIIARARMDEAEQRLVQAGADRIINPQAIGGRRAGAMALQPHVAEFVDVVMHDNSLEFRLEELAVPVTSVVAGQSIRDAHLRDRTGALVLAMRRPDGTFITNPAPETSIEAGHVLIVIGTPDQLRSLGELLQP